MLDRYTGIIWDWNGTLLNDTLLCVKIINEMLEIRRLPLLSIPSYKNVFAFPVKDYYQKIGFDFEHEPFEIPALEFIERYNEQVSGCSLHQDSLRFLDYFHSIGIRQFILSAMHEDVLNDCLKHYRIEHFFEHVSGLDNHFAASKTANGHRLITELNLDVKELILIGDTIHDFEVATELGCQCVLIANGHQSKTVLETIGVVVLDELNQLLD